MMREAYSVKLMDEETAFIFVEQVDETVNAAFNRYIRTPDAGSFNPATVKRGKVWQYTITIGETTLYGTNIVATEKRHALLHAWQRLERDEGILPGATLEKR